MFALYVVGIAVLIFGKYAIASTNYEFFEHEQAAFTCKHNKTLAELSKVQWKKGTDIYATVLIESGTAKNPTYNSAVESRVNLTFSALTILSMELYDDGEFTCIAEDSNFDAVPTDASFTLLIKVKPHNYQLLYNNNFTNCSNEIIVDGSPSNLTLECSVESKPQATMTWSTNPQLSESLLNETKCVRDNNNLPYTCTTTLTLPSDKVQNGIQVTCHVEAAGIINDMCIKLAPLTTTQVITTTVGETSTASPTSSTAVTTRSEATSTASTSLAAKSIVTSASVITSPAVTEVSQSTPTPVLSILPLTADLTMRLNQTYSNDLGNSNSEAFKNLSSKVCAFMYDSFNKSLVSCNVTAFRNGSVLIDAILQFNFEVLKEELKGQAETVSIDEAIQRHLQQNDDPFFRGAEISVTTDHTTKSPMTTPANPTSAPTSKWKNIYILPIAVGAVIIIAVIVLLIYRWKASFRKSSSSSPKRKTRKGRLVNSHKPPNAMQTSPYGTYDVIQDTVIARPPMKPQHTNVDRPQRNLVRGQPSNSGHDVTRNSEPVVQNADHKYPGQTRKNGRGETRRSEQAKRSNQQTRPDRQFQHNSAADYQLYKGYSQYRGYLAYRGYPAYRGYSAHRIHQTASSQMPVMFRDPAARAYNNYTGAPNY